MHVISTPQIPQTLAAAVLSLFGLPIHSLPVEDVVKERISELSLSDIEKAVQTGHLYCVTNPTGEFEIPVWQFCQQSPALLSSVLPGLFAKYGSWIEIFLLSFYEDLHGLAPAEVLAGYPLSGRTTFDDEMIAIWKMPADERIALVQCLTARSTMQAQDGWMRQEIIRADFWKRMN